MKKRILVGVGIFLVLLVFLGLIPATGTINYGICKVFVERIEPYPQSIKYTKVEEGGSEDQGFYVTMYYKKTDPFGEDSVNSIVCSIKKGAEDGKLYLSKVDINGKNRKYVQETPEYIKKFNVGIPAIVEYPPDLVLPYVPSEGIKDYKDIL